MTPHKLYFVGVQLLLLAYAAQSFVMITANMEDVKKIARKFISESLADKIAEFVVKATQTVTNQMANASDESEQHIQDISDNNYNYKLRMAQERQKERDDTEARQRRTTKDERENEREDENTYLDSTKELHNKYNDNEDRYTSKYNKKGYRHEHTEPTRKTYIMDYKKDKSINLHDESSGETTQLMIIDWQKENNGISRVKNEQNHNRFLKQVDKTQDNRYKRPSHRDLQTEDNDHFNKYKKNKDVTDRQSYKNEQRTPDRSKSTSNETPNQGLRFKKRYLRDHEPFSSDREDANDTDKKFNALRTGPLELSTKREKSDFDQYDNRNYKKSFIATSGPVMLPKMRNDQQTSKLWWEREIPSDAEKTLWF